MNIADLAFTSVLALAAILATLLVAPARADARNYAQFAAALYGALALADFGAVLAPSLATLHMASAVSLIVLALAPASLALAVCAAFENPPPRVAAAASLVLGCMSGILAAATGADFIAMAALFASVCAMLVFAVRRWHGSRAQAFQAGVAGIALIAGAAAGATGGMQAQTSLALFSAGALLGAALACAKRSNLVVEKQAVVAANVIPLIRRQR